MAELGEQKILKYTVTHHRKEGRTHEEFLNWIIRDHIPLALPVLKKHGCIEYSIFSTPADLNGALRASIEKVHPTWEYADYDCIIEYSFRGIESIGKVMADPEWHAALKDDDEWVDKSKALLSLGYSTPFLLTTGEVVNLQ
ncbi:unnamed protein product [Clonostachys rosea]|uniref:EthD domain-containing protein n=1 Tax=Bionectria ochroleuca TaxID=29856 RepID=A0ABY6UFG1_BIOOC|nr:unnamed protein product [Clonostachys rosea]